MLFVKDSVRLADPIRRKCAEWANANSTPLRILSGNFAQFTPGSWTQDEVDACGTTLDVANEIGVTMIVWGSNTEFDTGSLAELPGAFYTDGTPRPLEIKEIMKPRSGAILQGIPLEHGGFEFGEFSGRKVWYFMYLDYIQDDEKLSLDHLITIPLSRACDPNEVADFEKLAQERAAKAFAKLMMGNPEARMRDVRNRIDDEVARVTQREQENIAARSRLELMRREFDTIIASMTQPEDHWLTEYHLLVNHPKIAPGTLRISDRTVEYETLMLSVTLPDESELPMGRFRIRINLDEFRIKIKNINNARDGRDHPHVPHEDPCWGGYDAEVVRYMENSQVSELVEFLFGYLQSYNADDDWGRYIRLWRDNPEVVAA